MQGIAMVRLVVVASGQLLPEPCRLIRLHGSAAELFDRAANQGEPTAQLFLATMHFRGDGVPRNLPLALMWLELAMAGGQSETFELRGAIMQSMTDAEREESGRLLARWRATHMTSGATTGPRP